LTRATPASTNGRTPGLLLAAVGCLALLLAAYANSLGNAFHFDDSHVVVDNLYVRSLANAGRFFTDVRTVSALPQNQTYRPLVTLSLAVDYFLGHGLSTRAFHLDQLFLLVLLGIALFFFYLRVMERASPSPANAFLALFSATLFCVHTVNTETLNLMHARSEILSALGIVGGLLVYLGCPRLRRFQVHLVPMAAGALAKTPAVLLAPLLLVWELLAPPEGGPGARSTSARLRTALRASAPAFVVAVLLFWFVEKRMAPPTLNYGGGDRIAYAQTQLWVWLHYLRLFVLPLGLSADTDLSLIRAWYDTRVLAGACALAGLAWVALRCARATHAWPVTFGLAWFAIGLLPTSSVIPLAEPLNEHRVFLPFIGLVLSAVWGARLLLEGRRRRGAVVAVCAAILVALGLGTHVRNRTWLTDERLWADVTVKSPANGRGWMNYGLALMARGELARARSCYERAALLVPNYWTLETNRAIVEGALGNAAAAESHFKRAIELGPSMPDTHYFFARWLASRGRAPEAVSQLETALRVSPGTAPARRLLVDLRAAAGDSAGAAALARETLAGDPQDARARAYAEGRFPGEAGGNAAANRQAGIASGQGGDYVASAVAYRAALAVDPSDADSLNNLGWTLGKLGFFPQAVSPLERAIAMRPDFALARNNLAWVRSHLP
jgi:tetratricopeptide (TPR) repeat protein